MIVGASARTTFARHMYTASTLLPCSYSAITHIPHAVLAGTCQRMARAESLAAAYASTTTLAMMLLNVLPACNSRNLATLIKAQSYSDAYNHT